MRDRGLGQLGVAVAVPGQVGKCGLDDSFLDRAEGHASLADALRADQSADQREPPGEDNRSATFGLCSGQVSPPVSEGSERERVDPGGESVADGDGWDAERPAQRFILVLGIAGDQHSIAEGHQPGCQGLDRGRLAATGFPEDEHIRVGDRDPVIENPASRVGVEAATGELVDTHQSPGRRQAGSGNEGPQHRRLIGGQSPDQRRRGRRRPAMAARGLAAAWSRTEQPWLPHDPFLGRFGRQRVTEVSKEFSRGTSGPTPPAHRSALRVSEPPSGMVETAKPTSWARSSRSGANPALRMLASRRRPASLIGDGRATVTVATA